MHYQCLIVDDEIELAKSTAEYMEMFDIKTAYVASAAECYAFFAENDTELILLDINLQDGYVGRLLKDDGTYKYCRFFVYTEDYDANADKYLLLKYHSSFVGK